MSENKVKSPLQIQEEVAEKVKPMQKKIVPVLSENKLKIKKLADREIEDAQEEDAAEEVVAAPKIKKKKKTPSRIPINIFKVFGILERNQVVNAMPFILFVTVLLMFYISNTYYAEGVVREIDKTKFLLKERRAEYISTMSRLMYQSKQSEVAKALLPTGIKESTEPPKKIFVTGQSIKK